MPHRTALLFLLILGFSHYSTVLCKGKKLRFTSHAFPPYNIAANHSGVEIEIIKSALSAYHYSFELNLIPFARVPGQLDNKKTDIAAPIGESSGSKVYYSDYHIMYQNYAITAKKYGYQIKSLEDLSGKSVYAFQHASQYLGNAFRSAVKKMGSYEEYSNLKGLSEMIFIERNVVIILDVNIFNYFWHKLKKRHPASATEPSFHDIFPNTKYKAGFLKRELRDQFNTGLKQIVKDGTYGKIMDKYYIYKRLYK